MAISFDGANAYVVGDGTNAIEMYVRDTGTGELTDIGTITASTSLPTFSIIISNDDNFVYVPYWDNGSNSTINVFSIYRYECSDDGDITPYLDLVTTEHQDKQNFMAMIGMTCQPFADLTAVYKCMMTLFDVDTANGEQLDVIGQWVGITRNVLEPLPSIWFSFGIEGLGFGQGYWYGKYVQASTEYELSDNYYRLAIKMKILNNHWNGTIPQAYSIADVLLAAFGYQLFIQDNEDMSMDIGLLGAGEPDLLTQSMMLDGLFDIRPAGVLINHYYVQSGPLPIFAFGIDNQYFAGFGQGSWAIDL